ncbi:MAG TPA: c-type cytochrome [Parvularculaceae bacterium]|nr:c-type cytochrome [Parvularculaceae bacterium]
MRATISVLAAMAAAAGLAACTQEETKAPDDNNIHGLDTVRRELDSSIGHGLFVEKGCVICHSINGIGGKAAPALDAQIGAPPVDPLDFAARMWRGAPAMIELQSVELGYTIYLTADEIAHLAAFAADREEQARLKIEDVPEPMRGSFLDEQFWEVEDWGDFLRNGQEGYEPPVDESGDAAPEGEAEPEAAPETQPE